MAQQVYNSVGAGTSIQVGSKTEAPYLGVNKETELRADNYTC